MTNDELEDWNNLVKSPGWLRLKSFAQRMYSDDLHRHLMAASSDRDDLAALNKVRQVAVAKDAIERLMKYPDEQIAKLDPVKHPRPEATYNRRGGL